MSSSFYTQLCVPGRTIESNVGSWHRSIPLFKKKMLIIPINIKLHWNLIAIVNTGLLAGYNGNDERPCMLAFDSANCHSLKRISQTIIGWLNFEYQRTFNEESVILRDSSFTVSAPKGEFMRIFLCASVYPSHFLLLYII